MSRKKICLVPAAIELTDLPTLNCYDESHAHISNAEMEQGQREEKIELNWFREPERYRNGVVRKIQKFPGRGLSCYVGGPLANAVYQRDAIAREHVKQIRCSRTRRSKIRLRCPRTRRSPEVVTVIVVEPEVPAA